MEPKSHPDNASLPLTNRPETILGVTITFLTIAIIAVSMRLYVRMKQKLWGWDDLCVVLAIAAVTAGSVLICLMTDDGLGLHFWTLNKRVTIMYFKHVWATNVTYSASATFIKLAILIQYLRLFEMQHHRLARKLTWGLIVITSLWGLAYLCLALFSCSPIRKNWHPTMAGKCIGWGSKDPEVFFVHWVAHNASNMVLDMSILLLPAPFFRQLKMTRKTRLGFIALFTMGAIACVLSLARLVALSYRRVGTIPVFDVTYYTPIVYIFSVLEIDVAILCASIPIFWPLVASFASNKIFIINEIEIRTERRSDAIGLADHGHAGFGQMDFDGDGRTSRMSVLAGKPDLEKIHGSNTRIQRSMSRQQRHKPSSSSPHKAVGISIGSRPSQDSQRDLNPNLSHSESNHSFNSTTQSPGLAPSTDNTRARYADKYMQDWAVPDFESRGPLPVATTPERTFTTTVERAEIPYDHIRAMEK